MHNTTIATLNAQLEAAKLNAENLEANENTLAEYQCELKIIDDAIEQLQKPSQIIAQINGNGWKSPSSLPSQYNNLIDSIENHRSTVDMEHRKAMDALASSQDAIIAVEQLEAAIKSRNALQSRLRGFLGLGKMFGHRSVDIYQDLDIINAQLELTGNAKLLSVKENKLRQQIADSWEKSKQEIEKWIKTNEVIAFSIRTLNYYHEQFGHIEAVALYRVEQHQENNQSRHRIDNDASILQLPFNRHTVKQFIRDGKLATEESALLTEYSIQIKADGNLLQSIICNHLNFE